MSTPGRWLNGKDEAVRRLRQHIDGMGDGDFPGHMDANDKSALAYLLHRLDVVEKLLPQRYLDLFVDPPYGRLIFLPAEHELIAVLTKMGWEQHWQSGYQPGAIMMAPKPVTPP